LKVKLGAINGKRDTFQGIFERYGTRFDRKGRRKNTILIREIKNGDGCIIADHLWFNDNKDFRSLGRLNKGVAISFDARVKPYKKGYHNPNKSIKKKELDYHLTRLANIRVCKG